MNTPPYPMHISPDQALNLVLERTAPATPREFPLAEAAGLALAENIHADRDYPPFDRATMDGYAVRLADAGQTRPVLGEAPAGRPWNGPLPPGGVLELMTGAAAPQGTEAVVPREQTQSAGEGQVALPASITPGQNIMPRGREAAAGALLLQHGAVLTPLALGVLAAAGRQRVKALPPPRVALALTGDELHLDPATPPPPGFIRDSNAIILQSALSRLGVTDVSLAYIHDNEAEFRALLAPLLEGPAAPDFIVFNGGVSAGKYDLIPAMLAEAGARIVFHKVTQQPGKPLLFATRERPDGAGRQLIFGLPGNPLSSHLGMRRYVFTAIRRHMGLPLPPQLTGRLAADFSHRGDRTLFQLARAEWDGGAWRLTPLTGKGSADLFAVTNANALIRFKAGAAPWPAGTEFPFTLLD